MTKLIKIQWNIKIYTSSIHISNYEMDFDAPASTCIKALGYNIRHKYCEMRSRGQKVL